MTLKIHFQKLQIQKTKRLECTSKVHYLKNENNLQIHNIEHGVILQWHIQFLVINYISIQMHMKNRTMASETPKFQQGQTTVKSKCVNKLFHQYNK